MNCVTGMKLAFVLNGFLDNWDAEFDAGHAAGIADQLEAIGMGWSDVPPLLGLEQGLTV